MKNKIKGPDGKDYKGYKVQNLKAKTPAMIAKEEAAKKAAKDGGKTAKKTKTHNK